MRSYRRAIHAAVRPGDVVLDIGSGTGILSLFACEAKASRVYAIENTRMINVARKMAAENGFGERISFLQQDARLLDLPESVDVIVSELLSNRFLGQRMEELIGLAKRGYLKRGGRLVPRRVRGLLLPVQAGHVFDRFRISSDESMALDLSHISWLRLNLPGSSSTPYDVALSNSRTAYRYESAEDSQSRIDSEMVFPVHRRGVLHGFHGWFVAQLAPGIYLANHGPLDSWDNVFFPVLEPVAVRPGAEIRLHLRGYQPEEATPLWQWHTEVRNGKETVASFRQSNVAVHVALEGEVPAP